jgi:hypothetical protein
MTTEAQVAANKRNAIRSTGPKTAQGKSRSSGNAVRHGFRSELAVLPFEQAEAWERHRDGVTRSLTPVGTLEEVLALRVALCLWRLQRVAVYEAAIATAAIEATSDEIERHECGDPITVVLSASAADFRKLDQVEEELEMVRGHLTNAKAELAIVELLEIGADDATPVDGETAGNVIEDADNQIPRDEDDVEECFDTNEVDFLVRLGVPEDELDAPWDWQGWTAGMVRRGIAIVAAHSNYPAAKLLARMVAGDREQVEEKRQEVRSLEAKAKAIRRRAKAAEERARLHRVLPDEITLEKLSRYEAHLSRQLLQALHELERLKAARAGAHIPPLATLDVTVSCATPALELELENANQP